MTALHGQKPRLMRAREWMPEIRSGEQGHGFMAKLIIAPSAENDLNAIVDYISKELCNPEAAEALLDAVDDCYGILETLPSSFSFCRDPVLRANGYHQTELNGYILVYRIEDNGEVVRVLHYYHSTQDYLIKLMAGL